MTPRIPKTQPTEMADQLEQMFGVVPEPLEVMWHHPKASMAALEFGAKLGEWDTIDESLKSFAHMAVAAQVGCSWCLDFNYFQAENRNLDMTKASEVPRWRTSTAFTPLERDVLEYAEAMTNTPTTAGDDLVERLLEELGPAGMVELTAVIGFANFSTRCNTALGVESQEFSADCVIPLATR